MCKYYNVWITVYIKIIFEIVTGRYKVFFYLLTTHLGIIQQYYKYYLVYYNLNKF